MSRKAGTLLALAAVVAVGVAGYEVADHLGGESFARGATPPAGSSDAGPSGTGSVSPVTGSSSPGAPSAGSATAGPSTSATRAPRTTRPANPESGQTLATDPPVRAPGSSVPVVVTFHDWNATTQQVMVGGYVSGLIENGGTCTLTLTSGSATAHAEGPARADASTTDCGALTVARGALRPGSWTAVLSYRSPAHHGSAAPVTVDVPQ